MIVDLTEMLQRDQELDGFDVELVGFDCAGEIEPDQPPNCPWKPGCGLTVKDCPLMKRLAMVCHAPKRVQ
jgi:hypothetical protein